MLPGKPAPDSVPASGPRQHGGPNSQDLNWAWNTIDRVRTEIRRMEHRLDDPDLRLPPPLTDQGRDPRPFDPNRDLDQTYTVGATAAAKASCEKYDYSAYQRNKSAPSGGRRKVSRLGEKYHEEPEPTGRVGRRSERDTARTHRHDVHTRDHHQRDVRMGSPKRVDFSRSLHLREVNNDGTYLDSIAQHESSSSSAQSLDVQSTLTDSRAIRETDIRFLNDRIHAPRNYQDVRWDGPASLTRVNVQVPSTRTGDSGRTENVRGIRGGMENVQNNLHNEAGAAADRGSREDHGKTRRLKKMLKDLTADSELFAKLKEKIHQQRLSASSASDTSQDSFLSQHAHDENPQHVIHSANDVVATKQPGDGATERHMRSRKVAAGPPVPVYRVVLTRKKKQSLLKAYFDDVDWAKQGFAEIQEDARLHVDTRQLSRSPNRKKPKKVVGKAQRKTAPEPQTDSSEKPKKLRIVAGEVETTKGATGAKGIITTSSWRAGQELILQTLGPSRTSAGKKSSQTKKSEELNQSDECKTEDVRRPDGAETHNLMSSGNREGAVGGNAKSLSSEARRILDDLELEDGEPPRQERRRKRKAPKLTDPEKMEASAAAKQRHYDPSKVRKFMQKQKADRLKKKREEERESRQQEEKRRKHLEELYCKQKPKEPHPVPEQRTKSRAKRGGEEDGIHFGSTFKDHNINNHDLDVDDDESTLTEGTEDDVTPTGTPRDRREEAPISQPQPASTMGMGVQKLNLDVAAVLSKFSEIVNRKKDTGEISGTPYQQPRLEHSHRSQADRIKAVKETSIELQSKLASSLHLFESGATSPREPAPRYDRIVGSRDDYNVFDSNLPGSLSTRVVQQSRDQNAAATCIQAAFRGHTVRQSMNWPLPSGNTLGTRFRSGEIVADVDALEESSITETSTFSDITITEDSENESMNSPPGKMLKHVRGREGKGHGLTFKPTNQYKWEEPRGDPLSVLNVYQQKLKRIGREGQMLAHVSSLPRDSAITTQEVRPSSNQGSAAQSSTNQRAATRQPSNQKAATRQPSNQKSSRSSANQQAAYSAKPVISSVQSRGETQTRSRGSDKQKSSGVDDVRSHVSSVRSHASDVIQTENRHSRPEASFRPVRESVTDDSCTHSVSDEDDLTPTAARLNSRSARGHVGKSSEVTGPDSDSSLVNDDDMSMSRMSRVLPPPPRPEDSREPGRFSPNTLERKMFAELNRLESMEETLHQLTSVDRTRAVSMAQQETVSLAQMLKARQQSHELEMRQLKLQARKEAEDANRQFEETTRQRPATTIGAAGPSDPASTRISQEELARLKKEAIRQTAEAWNLGPSAENRRPQRKDRSGASERSRDVTDSVSRSRKPMSATYNSSKSYGRSGRSVTSGSVKTARDSRHDTDSDSIHTVSDAEGRDSTRGRSIPEDIHDEDYTMSFDESMTEDESFRQVLPSESHRKEVRRRQGDPSQSLADETGSNSRLAIGDLSSLFVGEDNFSRFTAEMVRQIMREEELRAQHQAALLRLREKALKEKTKAELAWIKQQKQQIHHGGDDKYPNILRQEQSILKRQKEQQEEIRRLQEANKLASRERQSLLQQHEEIAKMRQSTKKTLNQLNVRPRPTGRLNRPDDVHTEDEVSALEDGSDASEEQTANKDYKSDSEVYSSSGRRKDKGEKQKIDKQMKNRLDQKYLTSREQRLHNRRRNAEELLAWRQRLDEEEQEVYSLEKKALSVWDKERDGNEGAGNERRGAERAGPAGAAKQDRPPSRRGRTRPQSEDTSKKGAIKDASTPRHDETTISEQLTTAHDESGSRTLASSSYIGKSDAISTQISATERSQRRSRGERPRSPTASGSEGSIPEEIPIRSDEGSSVSSPEKHSVADDYTNDTFEHDTTMTSRRKSPVGRFLPQGRSPLPSRWSRKGGSDLESESEDSVSHTETLSDASDYEVRIRQLSDELRRRRKEADILKKDRKKKAKEKMRAQEDSLKKQIEAYDNYINQLKHEQSDLEHDVKSTVKPQIKQPKVKTGKSPRGKDVSPTKRTDDHNHSSSFEDSRDGTESNQTSPSLSESRDSKLSPVEDKPGKKKPFLDRISEGSESDKSAASSRQKQGRPDKSESSVSEAIEVIQYEDESVSERTVSGLIQVKTGQPTDADKEESFSQDKLPHSRVDQSEHGLRTDVSVSEHIKNDQSLRSESTQLRLDLSKDAPDGVVGSVTGIQESDSDNETKSHHTLSYSTTKSEGTASRPSSEKSVASTNYSQDFEDEVSESEKTPTQGPAPESVHTSVLPSIKSSKTEEDISEQISASLPSITDKKSSAAFQLQDSFDNDMLQDVLGGFEKDEDEDKTPTETPREESPPLIGQEENSALLMTDPLADYNIGDKVLVWGRKQGQLLYKGKVDFAPGIWAGVELDKAEGNMDGMSDGRTYFSCRPLHGVLVHGSDISPQPDFKEDLMQDVHSPDDSVTDVSAATESELEKEIQSAAENVESFNRVEPEKPPRDHNALADAITDDLTKSIVKDTVDTMGKIVAKQSPEKKTPPKTMPKPKPEESKLEAPPSPKNQQADQTTDSVMDSMVKDAITEIMEIRKKQRTRGSEDQKGLINGHVTNEELDALPPLGVSKPRTAEPDILNLELEPDVIERPESPVPAESHLDELDKDISGLFGDDGYIDDDMDIGIGKPPPPYPGGDQAQGSEGQLAPPPPEEVVYVVPHQRDEVEAIVADAIDIYWNCRRCGEPMDNIEPPEDYFRSNENGRDMESRSKRVFKQLLFDLTGEIVREIYKEENDVDPPPWQKPKRKSQKYFKGLNPPSTVDKLCPIVQRAVSEIMGLNGAKSDSRVNKWNIRKRRDPVDHVLVQELQEEEPTWVNYDKDELSVKMQLTETILESLLTDTVDTFNRIYQKRHRGRQS